MYNAGKWKHVKARKSEKKYTRQKFTCMYIVHWTLDNVHWIFRLQISIDVIDWSNYFLTATAQSKMCYKDISTPKVPSAAPSLPRRSLNIILHFLVD